MRRYTLPLIAVAAVALTACAASRQQLPARQAQTADEIGPQTAVTNYGVVIIPQGGEGLPKKLADNFTVNANSSTPATDASQQGSTEQAAEQRGGQAGPVTQEPTSDLEADVNVTPGSGAGG